MPRKIIHTQSFMKALIDNGVVPTNCKHVVIDAEVSQPVYLYFECLGDEEILKVVPAIHIVQEAEGEEFHAASTANWPRDVGCALCPHGEVYHNESGCQIGGCQCRGFVWQHSSTPVYQNDKGWWFRGVKGAEHGPYETEDECGRQLADYITKL